ncbi:MAG: hypothetical protein LBT26_07455 [Clostridiales Family XIII bacterium]|nr:hypothetical protein [Clostridiales Family XIII bacterium]
MYAFLFFVLRVAGLKPQVTRDFLSKAFFSLFDSFSLGMNLSMMVSFPGGLRIRPGRRYIFHPSFPGFRDAPFHFCRDFIRCASDKARQAIRSRQQEFIIHHCSFSFAYTSYHFACVKARRNCGLPRCLLTFLLSARQRVFFICLSITSTTSSPPESKGNKYFSPDFKTIDTCGKTNKYFSLVTWAMSLIKISIVLKFRIKTRREILKMTRFVVTVSLPSTLPLPASKPANFALAIFSKRTVS